MESDSGESSRKSSKPFHDVLLSFIICL